MTIFLLAHLAISLCSTEQWRLIDSGGAVASHFGRLELSAVEDLRMGWHWSCFDPPQRFVPHRAQTSPSGAAWPSLLVTTQATEAEGIEVFAAPIAMWHEVPEHLLPRWPLRSRRFVELPHRPEESWRVRAVGSEFGSWWFDLPSGESIADLTLLAATTPRFRLVDAEGSTLDHGTVRLWKPVKPGQPKALLAFSWQRQPLAFEALPDAETLAASFLVEGYEPSFATGVPSSIPEVIRLRRGTQLTGRFVDENHQALANVRVVVEATVRGSRNHSSLHHTASDADGRFKLAGLPLGKAVFAAGKQGLGAHHEMLSIEDERLDLGTIVLRPSTPIEITIRDETGAPVPAPKVQLSGPAAVDCIGDGRCLVSGLGKASPCRVSAQGFLPHQATLDPDEPEVLVTLKRAYTVTGRFLDHDGEPIENGRLRLSHGEQMSFPPLLDQGALRLHLKPETKYQLSLSSPRTRETRLSIPAGEAGELLELGDIQPPPGAIVVGRLIDQADGRPIPGARIWVPRVGESGPLLAWVREDFLEARSGDNGRFELEGLSPGNSELEIEASNYARWRSSIIIEPADGKGESSLGRVDLGDISLSRGSSVRLSYDGEIQGPAIAYLDPELRWRESDYLSAFLGESDAFFSHVPAGEARVWATDAEHKILCEELITVEPGLDLNVLCQQHDLEVWGTIRIGNETATGGYLHWQPPSPDVVGGVFNTTSQLGLTRQRSYGAGRPAVKVDISTQGTYHSTELTPGDWRVSWVRSNGMSAASIEVVIPQETTHATLDLDFPGRSIHGTVVGEDGEAKLGARVRELGSQAVVLVSRDGTFQFQGLENDRNYVFQAEARSLRSRAVTVRLLADLPAPSISLELGTAERRSLTVRIVGANGSGKSGGFLFLETDLGGQMLRVLNDEGSTSLKIPAPLPQQVRLAAMSADCWAFHPWKPLEQLPEDGALELRCGAVGTLALRSHTQGGLPRVFSADGWDLAYLLARMGQAPNLEPGTETLLSLPAGAFRVVLGNQSQDVIVEVETQTWVDIE